tara:strand:+ start:11534 stop:11833 length:300 start_codon:yes stop_codon:yes gene_type:complete
MKKTRVKPLQGKGASVISDRSGWRFPMNEMVEEPGTGWLVHFTESDGEFSFVEHPLNNLHRYLDNKFGDPYPIDNARSDPEGGEDPSAFTVEFSFDFDA